jgi:TonB family protein
MNQTQTILQEVTEKTEGQSPKPRSPFPPLSPVKWLGWLASGIALLSPLAAQVPPANAESARIMRLDKFVTPEFPEFLRRTGVLTGTVVTAISHDGLGQADDILVLESTDSRFTAAALEAIRAWRFEAHPRSPAPVEQLVPVVRFLFTSTSVSVTSTSVDAGRPTHARVRANSPLEIPNFSHCDARPKAQSQPMPAFPEALKGKVSTGTALVKFFVDAAGRARVPVAITATDPELAHAAVTAVKQWRFDPPKIDGKPVIVLETHTFTFGSP